MVFVELLKNTIVAILTGYLAFTSTLAGGIETLINPTATDIVTPTKQEAASNTPLESSEIIQEPLSKLKAEYEFGGIIPQILIENTAYQQAAIAAYKIPKDEPKSNNTLTQSEQIKKALVNIYCQIQTEKRVRTTTGTGIIINKSGVILTNAHVAQFLLLKESSDIKSSMCVIRTGNPATATYTADLLYIPPTWVNNNAALVREAHPQGTGERDYALLYVSGSVNDTPPPAAFNYLEIDTNLLSKSTEGSTVYAAGYPAEILYEKGAGAKLIPTVASTTIKELYTFGSNYADIFSIGNSAVGKQGSSGGPIVDDGGTLIGLIVTKGDPNTSASQSLRALTLSYINRTIQEETGFTLAENMRGNLIFRAQIFRDALIPFLSKILGREISEAEL